MCQRKPTDVNMENRTAERRRIKTGLKNMLAFFKIQHINCEITD